MATLTVPSSLEGQSQLKESRSISNVAMQSKTFAARLQLLVKQYKAITRGAACREQLVIILTCVSIIAESEGLVAMVVVAKWGQRGETGLVFSLRGHHINRGLRRPTAVGEVLRPLGLTH